MPQLRRLTLATQLSFALDLPPPRLLPPCHVDLFLRTQFEDLSCFLSLSRTDE